jgi:hypothetical protein
MEKVIIYVMLIGLYLTNFQTSFDKKDMIGDWKILSKKIIEKESPDPITANNYLAYQVGVKDKKYGPGIIRMTNDSIFLKNQDDMLLIESPLSLEIVTNNQIKCMVGNQVGQFKFNNLQEAVFEINGLDYYLKKINNDYSKIGGNSVLLLLPQTAQPEALLVFSLPGVQFSKHFLSCRENCFACSPAAGHFPSPATSHITRNVTGKRKKNRPNYPSSWRNVSWKCFLGSKEFSIDSKCSITNPLSDKIDFRHWILS